MEWSFRYIGPHKKKDTRDCATCNTVDRGRCVEHAQPLVGCPHCDAVRDKSCPAHCGVEEALRLHDVVVRDPSNYKWIISDDQAGVRDGSVRRERVELPDNAAKAERVAKTRAHFAVATQAILAQCALFPEKCRVDISACGDDVDGKLAVLELTVLARE